MARLATQTFYALQDTRTPVWTAAVSIGVNIVCGITFMRFMGHAGLALATTAASGVNVALLFWAMRSKIGPLGMGAILISAGKALVCALVMCAGIGALMPWLASGETLSTVSLAAGLGLLVLAGMVLYFAMARLVRSAELTALIKVVKTRRQA